MPIAFAVRPAGGHHLIHCGPRGLALWSEIMDDRTFPAAAPDSQDTPETGERIAKRLARAGLCSRRDAERWIAEGRVAVNNTTLASPAVLVRPGDLVVVDGKPVPDPEPARLWRYHKPAGLVTTARDEKGRTTVFDKLPADLPRVVSVGRLDLNTEGLLLLTNDGELARFLELPSTGWTRRYRVRVHGRVDEARLQALLKGPTIDGLKYGPIEAALDRVQGSNAWLSVGLKEGKNREIRKVMEAMELQVTRLIRIAYGPFQLGKLEEGAVEEVPRRVVKDQLARFFGEEDSAPRHGTATAKPKPRLRPGTPSTRPARPSDPKATDRPPGERARTERTKTDRSKAERSQAERPKTERPAGGHPSGERKTGERPPREPRGADRRR